MSKPISDQGKDLIRRIVQRNIQAGNDNNKPAISSLFKRLSDVRTISAADQKILDDVRKKEIGGGKLRDFQAVVDNSAHSPRFADFMRTPGMSLH